MTLRTKVFLAASAGVAAMTGMLTMSALAAAAVTPTVTATVQNSSNANITTAQIGASVHAAVTVASSTASTSPIGTVDFNLYSNQSCTGSPLTQAGVNLVNGSASSSATTVAAGGLSYIVQYNGQGDFNAATTTGCVSISATKFSPALSLSLSNTNVQAGSFVNAIPNLTGESGDADGTIAFKVYNNNSCGALALDAGSKTVTNGSTPTSDSWQFITPGTYYWQGVYSGDTNNAAATSTCAAAGTILTVVATTSPTSTPTLSTSLSNSNVTQGSSVHDTATLTNESSNAGGNVSYKVYTDNACSAGVMDAGTKTVTNGNVLNSNSIVFNTVGTYYWQAVYSGDANNTAATSSCQSEVLTVTTSGSTGGPGTISGTVFNDLNKNDKQDNGESGLSGWTVWLHKANATSTSQWWKNWFKKHNGYNDPIVATATTDSSGNYSFGNLSSGKYFVEEKVEKGWKQTSDDIKVVLDANKTSADVDFSNIQKKTATSTNNGNQDKDKNDDNNNDNNQSNNSNHNSWFKFSGTIDTIGNVFGWLKLSKK